MAAMGTGSETGFGSGPDDTVAVVPLTAGDGKILANFLAVEEIPAHQGRLILQNFFALAIK